MPWYPDRRQRYAHSAPWEHTPGTPNAANTTKSEAKTTLATRQSDTYEQNEKGEHVLVKGNMSAGTAFRKTTASKLAQSHLEQPPSLPNPIVPAPIPVGGIVSSKDFNPVLAKDASTVV